MMINHTILAILLVASVIFCLVTADSETAAIDAKNRVLPTKSSDDSVNEIVDATKKGSDNLDKSESKGQLDTKGIKHEKKKGNGGVQKDEPKENEGSGSKTKEASKEVRLPTAKEKCDSSSNRCTNDDKTLVACLKVPGDESPALSLLIQNKGKGSLSITISAPDSVQLEKGKIELQENKDAEVKVSIKGVESGHFILLSDGQGRGDCSIKLGDQFVGRKKVDQSSESSFNVFKLTLSTGFLFSAALLTVVVSAFMCIKLGRKYFARKGLKYQMLDMELPVSQGSKVEAGKNEGWDESWGDSWDDEEAPTTPSFPVTPSLSAKGMSSRKFKEGWKD